MLEHAFDTILEAGEIPPLSFFTEMACQATIQHDYERVVNIVNTMAHAPFQVGLQEWITLFERNGDRIDRASLNELQEKLVSHDLVKEATVLNLSKALQFICGSCEDSLNSIASTSPTMDKNPKASHDGINEHNFPANTSGSNLDSNLNIREGNSVNTVHDYYMSSGRVEKDRDSDEASGLSDNCHEDNVRARPTRFAEHFDYDLVSKSSPFYSDDIEFEHIEHEEGDSDFDEFNFNFIIPSSVVDDSHESGTPSAHEILENWKKK